ncbi:sensor histidine kinase [Nevskia ramosa]|uniref:sensor histidine kinase n=1 Tax=Nevskia ramosa TaxID=64002 RepID=UPI002357CEFC|nr:histidine kinase [Nevskia ramosa]
MKRFEVAAHSENSLIPEFCRANSLLTLAYVMELIAVVLTLAVGSSDSPQALRQLLLLSLYLQWTGLCAAAALCMVRRFLTALPSGVLFFICWFVLVLVTFGVSTATWLLDLRFALNLLPPAEAWSFVLRNVCIAAIVGLLLLRYLWENHQWQEESRAEADGRYLALQARIRPHFLFNALNSLAELIPSKPDVAEEMVIDLADLFRVSLDSRQRLIPLREEIEIVKGYMRIEEIRLGDKLLVNWEVPDSVLDAQVPRLTVQPLVENGVLHGVSRLRARGMLHVIARREGEFLIIDVENPIPPEDSPKRAGTGTAITNIAQRIKLIYGERAKLILGDDRDEFGPLFRARLRLPYVLHSGAELNAPTAEEE